MSTIVPAASFEERLARRRKEKLAKAFFELPVSGYESLGLWARYRVLGYDDVRTIGLRNEEEAVSVSASERATAADVLTEACLTLLEKTGVDESGKLTFRELNYRWSAAAARDLFDVDDLPEGTPDAAAIQTIFAPPHDMPMMTHFQQYMERADMGIGEVEGSFMGESRAGSEET